MKTRTCCVIALATCAGVLAQDLPDDLELIVFSERNPSEAFELPIGNGSTLDALVWHESYHGEKTVSIRWSGGVGSAVETARYTEHSVGFVPLDVCRASHTTDTLYVVGWMERLGEVVIEEWVFTPPPVIGAAMNPTTLAEETTFDPPTVTKTIVDVLDLPPIRAVCSNPYQGEAGKLYLLSYDSPKTLWSYDLDEEQLDESGGQTAPLDTELTFPALADQESLIAMDMGPHGFVVMLTLTPKQFAIRTSNPRVVYYHDAERDGSFEERNDLPYDEFLLLFPYDDWAH